MANPPPGWQFDFKMGYEFGSFGNFTIRNTKNVIDAIEGEDGVWRVPNLPEEFDWQFIGYGYVGGVDFGFDTGSRSAIYIASAGS